MTIRAVGHLILIKVEKPAERTKGGIVLPSQVRDAEQRGAEIGVVVDIGPTAYMADGLGGVPWINVGDRIFFAKYAGKWVKEPEDDAEEFLMIRDDDVCGRIDHHEKY